MPTYKQRPHAKRQTENLPFYRPIDRLAARAMAYRKVLTPVLIVAAVLLVLFGGFKIYAAHYEDKASALLNRGEIEALARDYGRSRAAKVARLKLGKTALDAKEYDRAAEWFSPVASDASAPALLRIAAEQNLALAYLKKGDASKAAEILQKASKDPANAGSDYTTLLLAWAEETGGGKDKALELYKTLAEGSKQPAVRLEAQERKKWLEPETKPAASPR